MKVLLCDDHTLFVEALTCVLRRRGDDVSGTGHPEDAVREAEAHRPDVCVMDLRFGPEGREQGLEAAAGVMEGSPKTHVLVLTGGAAPNVVRQGLAMGVRGFVGKGESLSVILQAIDAVADGEILVPALLLHGGASSRADPVAPLEALTARERQVLTALASGTSTTAMAVALDVSRATARTHLQNLYCKLGVHSRLEALAYAYEHGVDGAPDQSADGWRMPGVDAG